MVYHYNVIRLADSLIIIIIISAFVIIIIIIVVYLTLLRVDIVDDTIFISS